MLLVLAALQVGEPSLQDAHRGRLVLELRPFVLARDDDPGREVRDPDGGIRGIDPLAAGAAGAIHVDPKVLLVDLDLLGLRFVQRRDHVERREGGVASLLRVVGTDSDQSVDPTLRR